MAMKSSMPIFWVELWNAAAVPWNDACMESGTPTAALASRIAATASDRVLPGGRSKEIVTAGTSPEWLTESGWVPGVMVVTAASGTSWPLVEVT